uniref:DUF1086 domain-containing protein n=1 Tax=Macrostomum lignano TaxID=282301 RepID=A0A1I8FDK1_9PLAT
MMLHPPRFVRAGFGQKGGATMSKQELDGHSQVWHGGRAVQRWRTRQSDKDRIDCLIAASEGMEEKELALNDYLTSFKPADPSYWDTLLRHHHEQTRLTSTTAWARASATASSVNYYTVGMVGVQQDEDEVDVGQSDDESEFSGPRRRRRVRRGKDRPAAWRSATRSRREDAAALLSKLLRCSAFNRGREGPSLNAIMPYGLPPSEVYNSPCPETLRSKPERACFAPTQRCFMRHLCEPDSDVTDTFSDGVLRAKAINRQHVLTRIGIMALRRRRRCKSSKVEMSTGEYSMPSMAAAAETEGCRQSAKQADKDEKTAVDNRKLSLKMKHQSEMKPDAKPASSDEAKPDASQPQQQFMFNIDRWRAFTELHTIWPEMSPGELCRLPLFARLCHRTVARLPPGVQRLRISQTSIITQLTQAAGRRCRLLQLTDSAAPPLLADGAEKNLMPCCQWRICCMRVKKVADHSGQSSDFSILSLSRCRRQRYRLGDMLWAKQGGDRYAYHVQFFGPLVERAWCPTMPTAAVPRKAAFDEYVEEQGMGTNAARASFEVLAPD